MDEIDALQTVGMLTRTTRTTRAMATMLVHAASRGLVRIIVGLRVAMIASREKEGNGRYFPVNLLISHHTLNNRSHTLPGHPAHAARTPSGCCTAPTYRGTRCSGTRSYVM